MAGESETDPLGQPTPPSTDPDSDRLELLVRRALADEVQLHREFLMRNTRWVVAGFFGLLIVFGSLVAFIFGSQFDDRYIDAILGQSIAENIDAKISAKIAVTSKESLEKAIRTIQENSEEVRNSAIESIKNAVQDEIGNLLDEAVVEKIEEAKKEFLNQSSVEVLSRLIPSGAVVAFDSEVGCPRGWSELEDARGRMILGASNTEADAVLTRRQYREFGGAETHTLTVDEMPSHSHLLPMRTTGQERPDIGSGAGPHGHFQNRVLVEGGGMGQTTSPEGGGQPHNNMPPYIALYFCKKNP